jgi:AcrR family transcriptional regulator
VIDKLIHRKDSRAHVQGHASDGRLRAQAGRRASILAAALELFAIQGYRATTMEDLGRHAGIRGPSIYKHFSSKQTLLSEIMFATMDRLIDGYNSAVTGTDDVAKQLERAVETHIRYHARHRFEAFVGTREINSLDEPGRSAIVARRDTYEHGFRELIERGHMMGRFDVPSSRLASYAILDMGMGVAVWFRENGSLDEEQVVRHYSAMALRIVGADK